jgi:hypothetical protein
MPTKRCSVDAPRGLLKLLFLMRHRSAPRYFAKGRFRVEEAATVVRRCSLAVSATGIPKFARDSIEIARRRGRRDC